MPIWFWYLVAVVFLALMWLVLCGVQEWRAARRDRAREADRRERAARLKRDLDARMARWYSGVGPTARTSGGPRKAQADSTAVPRDNHSDDAAASLLGLAAGMATANLYDTSRMGAQPEDEPMRGGGGTFDGGGASAGWDAPAPSAPAPDMGSDSGSCAAPDMGSDSGSCAAPSSDP